MFLTNEILKTIEKLNMDFIAATKETITQDLFDHKNINILDNEYKEVINRLLSWESIIVRLGQNFEVEFFSILLTWKKVIEDIINNKIRSNTFNLFHIYKYEQNLSLLFPNNNNIKAKIRQIMQVLVQEEKIFRLTSGIYSKTRIKHKSDNEKIKVEEIKKTIQKRPIKNNVFEESINVDNNPKSIYKELENINVHNNDYYIGQVFIDEEINKNLIEYEIYKIKEFREIDYSTFLDIFTNELKLSEAKEVIINLRINLKELLNYKYFDNIDLTYREIEIVDKRAKGKTLEFIGQKYDVTRERVRQIERGVKSKYKEVIKGFKYNFFKIVNQTGSYIRFSQVKKLLGENADFVIYMLASKSDTLRKIITLDDSYQTFLKFNEDWYKNESNEFYLKEDLIEESKRLTEEFNQNNNKNFESKLSFYLLKRLYIKEGLYYFKVRPGLLVKYDVILKSHFDEGLTRNNVNSFKKAYDEVFPDDEILSKSDRAVFARAVNSPNIVPIDKGTYVYRKKDTVQIDENFLDDIGKLVKEYETLFIVNVFEYFKTRFKGIVNNRFELHHVLKESLKGFYFTRDLVSVHKNPSLNVETILEEYAARNNGHIDLNKVSNDVMKLKGVNLYLYLQESKNLFVGLDNHVFHKDFIIYDKEEMEKVKSLIEETLNNNIPVRINVVYKHMKNHAKKTVEKNNINRVIYAYNVFKNYYPNDFIYDYPFVMNNESKVGSRSVDYILEEFLDMQVIKISDIFQFINDTGLRIFSMKDKLEVFYSHGYMRLDDIVIAKAEAVLNSNVKYIFEVIEKDLLQRLNLVNEINLEQISFNRYPKINIGWNVHLIAHLLMRLSTKIEVETHGNQYNLLSYKIRKKV